MSRPERRRRYAGEDGQRLPPGRAAFPPLAEQMHRGGVRYALLRVRVRPQTPRVDARAVERRRGRSVTTRAAFVATIAGGTPREPGVAAEQARHLSPEPPGRRGFVRLGLSFGGATVPPRSAPLAYPRSHRCDECTSDVLGHRGTSTLRLATDSSSTHRWGEISGATRRHPRPGQLPQVRNFPFSHMSIDAATDALEAYTAAVERAELLRETWDELGRPVVSRGSKNQLPVPEAHRRRLLRQQKPRESRSFAGAGAGFEPATSGL